MNTNKNIEAYVVNILESYPKRELQISLLHYETQHTAHISPEEMIEGMSFAHGDSTGGRKGRISDKTMYIALNYQERMDRMNEDAANKIARRLLELESEQDRIRYYVSLLEKRESVVIRLTYFEGLSQEAVAESLGIVSRTMRRIKKRAIEKLAKMYGFAENPKR